MNKEKELAAFCKKLNCVISFQNNTINKKLCYIKYRKESIGVYIDFWGMYNE